MLGKRWIKIAFLIVGVVLLTTKMTDADLIDREFILDNLFKATTLDFSNRQTANEYPRSTLFNITGLIASGFEVETVRIKKEGKLNFDYQVKMETTGTWSSACDNLQLKVFRNWQRIYNGDLVDFAVNSGVNDDGYDDLVFSLSLPQAAQSTTCDFNFIIETYNQDPQEGTGFYDTEVLQNHVAISG